MSENNSYILTVNGGSSSIKVALYKMYDEPVLKLSGNIEKIDSANSKLIIKENNKKTEFEVNANNFHNATVSLIGWLEKQDWFIDVKAVGHRIVHGMHHTKPESITDALLNELNSIVDYDPDHLSAEIEIIKLIKQKHSQLLQVACFDTAFHTTIPAVAKTFAIPKKYFDEGIQRYGFHGIYYSYLMLQLQKENPEQANRKIVLAHLGNGASIAAVKNGRCIDTSMGFTPAGGIVMSSRSGDIDPGVAWFLMQQGITSKEFNELINHQSGLIGVSGLSSDMQELLTHERDNKNAALATHIFCYQIKKYIGGYAAILNGLDILVFSGGIGENAAEIRKRICKDFDYLNIQLDEEKNNKNEWQISSQNSKVKVYVIPTNEELMIAKDTMQLLNANK